MFGNQTANAVWFHVNARVRGGGHISSRFSTLNMISALRCIKLTGVISFTVQAFDFYHSQSVKYCVFAVSQGSK